MDKEEEEAYRIIFILVALVFAAFAVYNLIYLLKAIAWPYNGDYSEGVILATRLQYLYKSFGSYPYLITYYPPLYYLLVDAFRAAYHSSLPYIYTRSLGVFATLACALMIYLITKKSVGRKTWMSALAPLMFLSAFLISLLGIFPNPAQFELLFDLISIFILMNYTDKKALVYSSITLVVAFLFKQSALILFLAIVAYFVLNRKFKDCLLFAAPFLLIAVLVTLSLDFLTGGRYVFSLFVLPLITSSDFKNFLAIVNTLLFETPFLVFLPFAAYWVVKNPKSLLTLCFVFSFASFLSAIKAGSSPSYIIGLFALFCVISTMGIERVFSGINPTHKQMAVVYIFTAFVLIELATFPKFLSLNSNFQATQTAEVGLFLKNFTGNVLVESPSVAIAANKSVMFEPSMFSYMLNKGLWNDSQIVSDISMHRFSAIAFPNAYYEMYGRFFPYPDITEAVQTYYRPSSYVHGGWVVYVPNT